MSDSNITKRHHPVFGEIDSITDENGTRLYYATDVAKSLGYKSPHLAAHNFCKSAPVVETVRNTMPNGNSLPVRKRFCSERDAFLMALRGNTEECEALRNWVYEAVFPLLEEFSRDWLHPYDKEKETVVNLIFAAIQATNVEPSKFAEAYTNNLNRLTKD